MKLGRVALLAVRPHTGESGGAERLYEGLWAAMRASGLEVDLIPLVSDESDFLGIQETYLRFYDLDLSTYDGVISTKAPSYLVKHPNHVCYLLHTMRVFYDMFPTEFEPPSEEVIRQRQLVHALDTAALAAPRTKAVFAIGHEVKNRLWEYNRVASAVLYPAVDLHGLRTGPYEYVFAPSRLHRWKRLDLVIEAMQYVKTPVTLRIAGTGEDLPRLQKLAAGNERIVFHGRVTDAEMAALYANALVVPFVPVREDYGMVTIEAFLSHKPVITCADSGEPAQLVRDGESGFVCEPEPRVIAAKIDYLCSNPRSAARLGQRGAASVRHITWSTVVESLVTALSRG